MIAPHEVPRHWWPSLISAFIRGAVTATVFIVLQMYVIPYFYPNKFAAAAVNIAMFDLYHEFYAWWAGVPSASIFGLFYDAMMHFCRRETDDL